MLILSGKETPKMEDNNGPCYPRSLEAHQTTFTSISNICVLDVMIMFVDILENLDIM